MLAHTGSQIPDAVKIPTMLLLALQYLCPFLSNLDDSCENRGSFSQCDVRDQDEWRSFAVDTTWVGSKSKVTGAVDCSSLAPG